MDEMNAYIPLESRVKTSSDEMKNPQSGEIKETNLSNIEIDQLKNIITANMNYFKEKSIYETIQPQSAVQ